MAKSSSTKKKTNSTIKLKALSNLSGKYNLPYSEGQVFSIVESQAKELLENKDAEKVS